MENEDPGQNFWNWRRWLARLSFSFLIVAGWLGWIGYRGEQTQELSRDRVIVDLVCAGIAFILFLLGTRERHRPRNGDS